MEVDLVHLRCDTSTFLTNSRIEVKNHSKNVFLWMMLVKLAQWDLFHMIQSFKLRFGLTSSSRCGENWSYHSDTKIQAITYQELMLNVNPLKNIMMTLILFPLKMTLKNLRFFYFDLCLLCIRVYIILTISLIL